MQDFIKSIWILLVVFSILGLLSMIPLDKYHASYMKEFHRIKSEPQRRINATFRYIEAIENGEADLTHGISSEPPAKYYDKIQPSTKSSQQLPETEKYKKPRYIRDKNNPRILYPYKG